MAGDNSHQEQGKGLNIFEKYLTVWVALCIVGGIVLGNLATVVGVLIGVPVMLALVKICLRTQEWFPAREVP